jgi:hypothetical protein
VLITLEIVIFFRHPDATANAYIVFTMIGVVLFAEVISYYVTHPVFWILFIIIYFTIIITFCIHTYYNGMYSLFKVCPGIPSYIVYKLAFLLRPCDNR